MESADLDERSDCMKEDGKISKQIERITKYEILMNKAEQMIRKHSKNDKAELCKIMDSLEGYYLSNEWKQDFSDDEAGLLPPDLRRGVLSEDGIYNLIEKYNELRDEYSYRINT